ncbi:dehydrogenase/reductase SDR family member 4-like isoform X3 [Eublepharis macularius]|uniref:Dehydrogenase/reductase SDR family member 4-like isoform X3 n=1 Tax=Eublepharis macularius TaxID=481883 RepID=A0AA97LC73_EUBMA|nr:dehydrogenase/reductase SDR family member 4-like isoform X3 [Eublepharis macularius]
MIHAIIASLHPRQALHRVLRMASTSSRAHGTLADKVALVTASTEGIGFAIARRLGQDGAHVVLSSRKQANVDRAVAELQKENLSVSGLVCHVGKAEDRQRLIDAALERHGGIDILVSNAAVNPFFGSTLDATEDVWDKGWLHRYRLFNCCVFTISGLGPLQCQQDSSSGPHPHSGPRVGPEQHPHQLAGSWTDPDKIQLSPLAGQIQRKQDAGDHADSEDWSPV